MWTWLAWAAAPGAVVPLALHLSSGRPWAALVAYHALIATGGFLHRDRIVLRWRDTHRWLAATVAASAALLLLGAAAGWWGWLNALLPATVLAERCRLDPIVFYLVHGPLVNAPLEEMYWRGALLRGTGLAGGAVFFWLFHAAALATLVPLADAVLFTSPTLFFALGWGWTMRAAGTLWPCVITHAAADAALMMGMAGVR